MHHILVGSYSKLFCRLIAALSVMATLFVGVLIMTRIDSDGWQQWFLVSTLFMVVFLNICTAIYQGGLIGWTTQEVELGNSIFLGCTVMP